MVYMRDDSKYTKVFHLLWTLWGLIKKNSFLSWRYRLRKFSWKFWSHLQQLYQIICLCILVDTPDHQSFCSISMHLYGGKIESFFYHIILVFVFHIKISWIYNIFWVNILHRRSVIKLVKQKSTIGIDLFLLETFSDTFLLYNEMSYCSIYWRRLYSPL